MTNYLRNTVHCGEIILAILFASFLFCGCQKIQNTYIGMSSKQKKLIYNNWALNKATKDGIDITPIYCGSSFSPGHYDIDFRIPGDVEFRCPVLIGKSNGYYLGYWSLKEKNVIEITITDSLCQTGYCPLVPSKTEWEIKSINKNTMHIHETRSGDMYDFVFNAL